MQRGKRERERDRERELERERERERDRQTKRKRERQRERERERRGRSVLCFTYIHQVDSQQSPLSAIPSEMLWLMAAKEKKREEKR